MSGCNCKCNNNDGSGGGDGDTNVYSPGRSKKVVHGINNYKEDLSYRISVEKAALDGQKIEFASNESDSWYAVPHPTFDWTKYQYRVKKTPLSALCIIEKSIDGDDCVLELLQYPNVQQTKLATYLSGIKLAAGQRVAKFIEVLK